MVSGCGLLYSDFGTIAGGCQDSEHRLGSVFNDLMIERLWTLVGFARFFLHNLLDERAQGRNIFLGSFPQDLIVDSKVLVNQLVAHPAICFHGTFGCRLRKAGGIFFAASPIISKALTTAYIVF